MADRATSDNRQVQAQLDRLNAMSPGRDILGFDRLRGLLARLGNPERRMPPAFHIAGTNGKGSTCAYLRGAIEAAGMRAHVYTSPHLVRLNERIRLANHLVDDATLARLLADTLDATAGEEITFFEATTAAAFLGFARVPADAAIIEVGIGGRLDATNLIPSALACGIAQLGIDHREFLGDTLEEIAAEKAGIAKPGTPLVTQAYPAPIAARIAAVAQAQGATVLAQGTAWQASLDGGRLHYSDAAGELDLPAPALAGAHQLDNAGLAIALLRHQGQVEVSPEAIAQGLLTARWPARLQQLGDGPLTALAPGRRVWLDGGHNPDAGLALARFFGADASTVEGTSQQLHLILGMLASKDPAAIIAPSKGRLLSVSIVPIPGHDAHGPEAFTPCCDLPLASFPDVASALEALSPEGDVLIAGSLYLAGEVLRLNRELPD
jgi:dihydrofolate synthase/folylpolyglutamate synthase